MEVLREGSDEEMVLCYLAAELSSERFGAAVRAELAARDLRKRSNAARDFRRSSWPAHAGTRSSAWKDTSG